ncbi:hypothetical protein E2R23_32010 [Burkholderia pseudomallei]|nr:hypothetical protein EXY28_31960 [Burkholderia pseudomallei]QBI50802.1 hypothetical protein EXY72_32010 [Burkholderia pseudomallei]QBL82068.1 hypothetical protein EYA82_31840 [Burkholderia pseudomallei]QBL88679.1 hypothetical protein EYA88_31550 [Burkholderia pseudomallei]QBP52543.1 hypothetical protein E2R28_31720 [Burkholderia pseudomallei]
MYAVRAAPCRGPHIGRGVRRGVCRGGAHARRTGRGEGDAGYKEGEYCEYCEEGEEGEGREGRGGVRKRTCEACRPARQRRDVGREVLGAA